MIIQLSHSQYQCSSMIFFIYTLLQKERQQQAILLYPQRNQRIKL